jgi:membrane protease YdiL (CAAX protease family)
MRGFAGRIGTAFGLGLLAILIAGVAGGIWNALIRANLATTPRVPWSIVPMGALLWFMWKYLDGKWWPQSTSEARHRFLRANRVSLRVHAWAFLAGAFSIAALAGLWIVFSQLVKMPPDVLPDVAGDPLTTVIPMLAMAALVAPLSEEAGFRGYCQTAAEAEFRPTIAIMFSSFFFMLAHINHGLFWPKLIVYFLVGAVFGAIAFLTDSILPVIPVHILGDLTFFIFVWRRDAVRHLIWEAPSDRWFWLHVIQAIVFAVLAILAFTGLAQRGEADFRVRG